MLLSFDSRQGDQSITRDVITITRRYRLLGFNAIRVPFSFVSLFKTAPRNFYGTCQTTPDATLLKATTRPGISTPCEYCSTGPTLLTDHTSIDLYTRLMLNWPGAEHLLLICFAHRNSVSAAPAHRPCCRHLQQSQ